MILASAVRKLDNFGKKCFRREGSNINEEVRNFPVILVNSVGCKKFICRVGGNTKFWVGNLVGMLVEKF